MKTKTIKQKVIISAKPSEVFDSLMNSKKHGIITGGKAKVSAKAGGKFSVYEGYAHGKNLKLVKGKLIHQTWRAMEAAWPMDHFSTVEFKLKAVPKGTQIDFTQKEVPQAVAKSISNGWKLYYWKPMNAYFAGRASK